MSELREPTSTGTGTRYSEETKEVAYQLWAFLTSRNASEVSRLMMTEEYGGLTIARETVAYWAREYGWADRATKDVHSIAPDLRHQAFSELLFAGLDGAKYIRRVNAGQEAPNKVRAMLAVAAVDRIGFSPVGKGMPAIDAPITKAAEQLESLSGLPPDELMRREEAARSRKG